MHGDPPRMLVTPGFVRVGPSSMPEGPRSILWDSCSMLEEPRFEEMIFCGMLCCFLVSFTLHCRQQLKAGSQVLSTIRLIRSLLITVLFLCLFMQMYDIGMHSCHYSSRFPYCCVFDFDSQAAAGNVISMPP